MNQPVLRVKNVVFKTRTCILILTLPLVLFIFQAIGLTVAVAVVCFFVQRLLTPC